MTGYLMIFIYLIFLFVRENRSYSLCLCRNSEGYKGYSVPGFAHGKMYKRATFEHLALHSELVSGYAYR